MHTRVAHDFSDAGSNRSAWRKIRRVEREDAMMVQKRLMRGEKWVLWTAQGSRGIALRQKWRPMVAHDASGAKRTWLVRDFWRGFNDSHIDDLRTYI